MKPAAGGGLDGICGHSVNRYGHSNDARSATMQVPLPGEKAPLSSSLPGPLATLARLFERSSSDPFYAVLAYKDFKPEP
jgi:hypothetical protein